jgi:hypothetical protein
MLPVMEKEAEPHAKEIGRIEAWNVFVYAYLAVLNVIVFRQWGPEDYSLDSAASFWIFGYSLGFGVIMGAFSPKINLLVVFMLGYLQFLVGALAVIAKSDVKFDKLPTLVPVSTLSGAILVLGAVAGWTLRKRKLNLGLISPKPLKSWILDQENILSVLEKTVLKVTGIVGAILVLTKR